MSIDFDSEELLVLARVDLEKGNVEGGLSKLKRALAMPDCPAEAALEAARVYAQLGLRHKAKPLFEKYLEHQPRNVDARFQLGMISFEDGRRNDALAAWEAVLRENGTYPPALFFRALAVAQSGDPGEARKMLRSAMDVLPPDNLYFARSRELLSSLEAGRQPTEAMSGNEQAYKTQH
jgi:tetratricopeptide (TPR) repeat protein